MQPPPGKPAPKPNAPRPDSAAKPAPAGAKPAKPPASPAGRVQDATQVLNDAGAPAQPVAKRPAVKDTDAPGLAGTEVFNEPPAAAPPKAAARPASAAPARPAPKPQQAESLDATEMFADTPAAAGRAPAGKAPAAKVANTSALEATGEFTDSDDAGPPKRAAAASPKPKPKAAASEEELGVFGDFQLTKKLGEGGMGSVYKAQQISMDRPVALKIMAQKIADNETFVTRFYREARTMARLDHPNIVRGYAVGQDPESGQHFVAMEFVEGGSMQNWMNKLRKLSVGDAVHVTLCSAAALQHAHEQNLIHRDIKPDNILVSNKGVVKVADLGLAKDTADDLSLTRTGTGLGTAYYMPLEQYRDAKRVDGRADIYALGVMLYYFLTGDLPFKGNSHVEVVDAKTTAKYKPARQLNPEVPERLSLMMDKMIAKEPGHRYQTCADVIKDLDSLGIASEYLTFVGGAPGSTARLAVGTGAPSAKAKSDAGTPAGDDRPEKELWVISYPDANGNRVKKQVSTGRLRQLIERGEIDPATAQASRYGQKQLRALTSFSEFESLNRAQATTGKSIRQAEKLERAYVKTAKAEQNRQLFQKIGNTLRTFASYLFLLALLAGLAIGGFLFWKYSDKVLPKAKELISNPGGQSTPAQGAPATSAPAAQPTQQPPATGAQPAGSPPTQPAGK